jgi:hypothetical protein
VTLEEIAAGIRDQATMEARSGSATVAQELRTFVAALERDPDFTAGPRLRALEGRLRELAQELSELADEASRRGSDVDGAYRFAARRLLEAVEGK